MKTEYVQIEKNVLLNVLNYLNSKPHGEVRDMFNHLLLVLKPGPKEVKK